MIRAVLAVGMALLLAPAAASAEVSSGSMSVEISEDPWGLVFTDTAGGPTLTEHSGTGLGPTGTLGFRTAAGWFHATRAVQSSTTGETYEAELATTDPLGRRLSIRISPDDEGVLSLDVRLVGQGPDLTGFGIGFAAEDGERYLGFGERSNAVDQRGNTVENYVSDGPYQTEELPVLQAFVPVWGLRERQDATYFPVPWLLSTRGYGVLIDNPEASYFRLGTDDPGAWSLEVTGGPADEVGAAGNPAPDHLSLRFFAGPKPADVLRRFTASTGRQPAPAAPWYFGPWFQPDNDETAEVGLLQQADSPLSVAQTYVHYLPCGDHQGSRDAQKARTARLHDAGLAVTTYFNPMICSSYEPVFGEASAAGALTKDRLGQTYLYRYTGSTLFLVGQFDFRTDAGRQIYGRLLGEAIEDGYDGWMEDFGEYTPLDSQAGDGTDGGAVHNPYVTEYHCTAFDRVSQESRPIARFQRSGWTGAAPCAQIVWGGDPTTDWGFDGLRSAMTQALSIGASGISTWGSDIGGYFALGSRELGPELLSRWVQFGAVSGVMRTQANGFALPDKGRRPQVFDPDQLANWKRYSKLRTQLYPYLAAASAEYQRSGLPIMRHLALMYPGDAAAAGREDEFLFGPDLLAAPVVSPGATERSVYLPAGEWVDFWRSVGYDDTSGALTVGAAALIGGGAEATVPAPADELPLLVRAGAVLPLLPPDVDTLTDYGQPTGTTPQADPALVNLEERADQVHLLAFPRGSTESPLYENDRLVSTEGARRWQLGVQGSSERSYDLEASMATLQQPFVPAKVELDGVALPASDWSFDPSTQVLRARFRTGSGTLVALPAADSPGSGNGGSGGGGNGSGRDGGSNGEREDGDGNRGGDDSDGPAGATAAAGDGSNGSLPVTGLAPVLIAAVGLALGTAGFVLRRRRA